MTTKSGSNRTEKYTNRNNQTDAFPLSGMGYLGGFPFLCIHGTRVVEQPLVPYGYRGSKPSAPESSVKPTYESARALQKHPKVGSIGPLKKQFLIRTLGAFFVGRWGYKDEC